MCAFKSVLYLTDTIKLYELLHLPYLFLTNMAFIDVLRASIAYTVPGLAPLRHLEMVL